MTTKQANDKLLQLIVSYLDTHPGYTLSQALINLSITNQWDMENEEGEWEFEIIDWNEDPKDQLKRAMINTMLKNG